MTMNLAFDSISAMTSRMSSCFSRVTPFSHGGKVELSWISTKMEQDSYHDVRVASPESELGEMLMKKSLRMAMTVRHGRSRQRRTRMD